MIDTDDVKAALANNDRELAATLIPLILLEKDLSFFIDLDSRSIDFQGMLRAAGPWSSTERLLVRLAASYWWVTKYEDAEGTEHEITADLKQMVDAFDNRRFNYLMASAEAKHHGFGPYLDHVLDKELP